MEKKIYNSVAVSKDNIGEFKKNEKPRENKLILDQQSILQPVVWRCLNPECKEGGRPFEFMRDQPKCPKCTSFDHPIVIKRSLIHLLLPHPKGPIVGGMGKRFIMACDTKRTHLATGRNGESATGDPHTANCPGCRKKINETIANAKRDGLMFKVN